MNVTTPIEIHRPDARERAGPWEQSARLAFAFLAVGVLVLALGWAGSNVRQVPADSRAVVLRLGAFDRQQAAGLLVAWPHPIEQVILLPAADRQLEFAVNRFVTTDDALAAPRLNADARRNAGFLLTGDAGVVTLRATLLYQISDPAAYVIARPHVAAALERLFVASAVAVTASRDLDAILVARPDRLGGEASGERERLRSDLLRATNARLAGLAAQGAGLGVTVRRVDIVVALPAEAKEAFDEVLRTTQAVETEVARARTYAETRAQEAAQQRDQTLTEARAAAAERRSLAGGRTAAITGLATQAAAPSGRAMLERIYAERISRLLRRAKSVESFDPRGGAHLILPGNKP